MREMKIACPKCGRSDAIRKVISIVSAGSSQSQSAGYGMTDIDGKNYFVDTQSYGSSKTGLATLLSAPRRPAKPTNYGCVSVLLFGRVGLSIGALALIGSAAVCTFPLLSDALYQGDRLLMALPILIFASAAIGLLWWIVRSVVREARATHHALAGYPNEIERWERAMERWRELYYCSRDHGVFLPNQSQLTDVKHMHALLYATDKRKR